MGIVVCFTFETREYSKMTKDRSIDVSNILPFPHHFVGKSLYLDLVTDRVTII